MTTALFTIGYEGLALDEFLARLKASKIDRVIDIRELPLSRRRGFSKAPLAGALRDAGIDYVHLRSAGNPYRKEEDALVKYRVHIADATPVIEEVADAARGRRAALLCYEADPATCHRSLIAPHVAKHLKLRDVSNL
ncbi:MAG: DUF488 domain-containing protein [Deltaproteobacteria bacterium]|nr:DUF488 domain-containing protein [Deltaproteobacteria bacterium]